MTKEHTKSELDMLRIIEEERVISQAALSRRMGIAAGLVNFLMKRAISKGIVIAKRVPARRYAYVLTPKGFAEKARLVADYMNTSLGMFRRLREDFDDLFKSLSDDNRRHIVIVGDIELVELAILSSFESDVEITGIVSDKTNRKSVAKIPVVSHTRFLAQSAESVTFVVADIYKAQTVYDELVEAYGDSNVVAPKSLYVAPQEKPEDDQAEASK